MDKLSFYEFVSQALALCLCYVDQNNMIEFGTKLKRLIDQTEAASVPVEIKEDFDMVRETIISDPDNAMERIGFLATWLGLVEPDKNVDS
jgi:hypothetical protein